MPRFAANLTMMYPDMPFLDRFEGAAKDGFKAEEYLFPYAYPAAELAARLKGNGLQQVLFNMPPGGLTKDEMTTGWTVACAAPPACPGVKPSSAPALRWHSNTPKCWNARASTPWWACAPRA